MTEFCRCHRNPTAAHSQYCHTPLETELLCDGSLQWSGNAVTKLLQSLQTVGFEYSMTPGLQKDIQCHVGL